MTITLKTPASELTRVGKTVAKQLEKLEIKTVGDLLTHYPFRYDDYSKILTIPEFKTRKSGTIKVKINLIANHRSPRKKMMITEAVVSDQTDSLKVVWFNQPYLAKTLKSGQKIYLAGKIDYHDRYGLQLTNPSYEPADKTPIHTGRLVPVYPTTARLSQKQIRFLICQTLPLARKTEDWLPRTIKNNYNLTDISFALEQIHFPQNAKWLERARHRLKFDELFLIQIRSQIVRRKIQNLKAPAIEFKLRQTKNLIKTLPFKLTNSQRKSAWEIIQDMGKNSPMNRLLEGDVGSGKTIVAAIAILNVLLNRYQAAYMAPTEILAEQHFKTIGQFFQKISLPCQLDEQETPSSSPKNDFDHLTRPCQMIKKKKRIKIALLTRNNAKINLPHLAGRQTTGKRKINKNELLKQISLGKIDLIIGTHALISAFAKAASFAKASVGKSADKQENVKFKKLGLVIIDEQHRFGVAQRAALINQSPIYFPHLLSMTATPIPRSVALTLYGDLNLSIIDEMPPGRKKPITKIIDSGKENEIYQIVRSEIKNGRQIFVICPLIDPSDKLGVKSVKEEYKRLSEKIFPEFKIDFLHGKLKAGQKEKIMNDFAQNKTNILISTTVVEVGIDVPNASIMLIKGAERFGLAQLYQLRGRIGRSQHQSYCFLFLESGIGPLPDEAGGKTKERLKALLTAKNGFELAEKDLEMRGPGQVFGIKQSGFLTDLKIAKLSDAAIIQQAQQAASQIFNQDPILEKYPLLKNKINESIKTTHLE